MKGCKGSLSDISACIGYPKRGYHKDDREWYNSTLDFYP